MEEQRARAETGRPTPARVLASFYATRKLSTLKDYMGDLRLLARFCGCADDPEAVVALLFGPNATLEKTQELVERYRDHMHGAKLAYGTVNRRLAVVRTLNRTARLMDAVSWEIDVSARGRKAHRETKGVSKRAVKRMSARAGQDYLDRRDRAIVAVAERLSLTRAEIVALNLDDYIPNPHAPGITVQGGTVRVGNDVKLSLDAWIEMRGFSSGPLFPRSKSLDRMDPDDILPLVRSGSSLS